MTEVNASDCDTAANKVDVSTTRMTTFLKKRSSRNQMIRRIETNKE